MHKTVTWLHNRDEFAHSSILVEITKPVFLHLNTEQKRFFVKSLPQALHAFSAHDFSAWQAILKQVNLGGYRELIQDCQADTSTRKLVRDFSELKYLAEDLNLSAELEFEFTC